MTDPAHHQEFSEAEWRSLRAARITSLTELWKHIGEKPSDGIHVLSRATAIPENRFCDVLTYAADGRWETDDTPRRLGRWLGVHALTLVIIVAALALVPVLMRVRSQLARVRATSVVARAAIEPDEVVKPQQVAVRRAFSIWRKYSTPGEVVGRRATQRIAAGQTVRPSYLADPPKCPTLVALRALPPFTILQTSDVTVEPRPCETNALSSAGHAVGRMLLATGAKGSPIVPEALSDGPVDTAAMAQRRMLSLPTHAALPLVPSARITLLAECADGRPGTVIEDVIALRTTQTMMIAAVREDDLAPLAACSPTAVRIVTRPVPRQGS